MDPRLAVLIAAFAERPDARACLDPATAFGACRPISRRFAAAARAAGLSAEVVLLSRWADEGNAEQVLLHEVVLVEGVMVDWSARQFADPAAGWRSLRAEAIAVPCLIPLGPGPDWPAAAWVRAGVTLWDGAQRVIGADEPLGPEAEGSAFDWARPRFWGRRPPRFDKGAQRPSLKPGGGRS